MTRTRPVRTLVCLALVGAVGCSNSSSTMDMAAAADQQPQSAVVVNEVFPHGTNDLTDPDWVELKNNSNATVDLSSYKVRDENITAPLPAGTSLRAGEYLIIYTDDVPDGGASNVIHVPFKLGSKDEFYLIAPSGDKADGVAWAKDMIPTDKAYGRLPDGTGQFALIKPSKGARNGL